MEKTSESIGSLPLASKKVLHMVQGITQPIGYSQSPKITHQEHGPYSYHRTEIKGAG